MLEIWIVSVALKQPEKLQTSEIFRRFDLSGLISGVGSVGSFDGRNVILIHFEF